ncbi:MotA/TolQ/ExbB proton channel family protein [Moraxella oblonga]|uniref:MotA/TolQ/ExbB proton channel family protein n=1 Tax=Moraxella oblonga TaxID=200413 RepID=UPI00082A57C6|nr:MotA/TolQ/ExbB proton channel family protein [Moraxella oblonga]
MDFAQYWQVTDAVSKTLFLILITLSLISWVVGISRIIYAKQKVDVVADELSDAISQEMSGLSGLEFAQKKTATEQFLLKHIANHRFELEKGLPILGTTAAIAPFIGLFGTVWGIFHALHAIGKSGQAGLAQVAAPVGEALIMTGLGLGVAIPAVIFFNIITRLNKKALYLANDTAHHILATVR